MHSGSRSEYFYSRNILITTIFSYAVEDHEGHARHTGQVGQEGHTCHVGHVGILGHEYKAGHVELSKKKIN